MAAALPNRSLNEEPSQNVRVTAEVTGRLGRQPQADSRWPRGYPAFTLADTLDAVAGRGAFEGRAVPAASLAVLYSNYTQLVSTSGSGISSLVGLRGKVISTGAAGSGTEVIALRMLRAAGLDPARDVTRHALGASESAGALKDGKVAAFFFSGGLPTAAIQDLAHTPGVAISLIPTADTLDTLQRDHGHLYFRLDIPANSYRGLTQSVASVGVANVLVVNRSMAEDLAYDITRVIFEKRAALAAIDPEASHLSLGHARSGSPAEYHPGAQRYFREQGGTQ